MALPFGRFQWTHLPMGTVVVQDIFQSKLDAIFIGMEGVTGIADDMIIAGKDKMEHDRNFLAFMEKCMENNLTLNAEKRLGTIWGMEKFHYFLYGKEFTLETDQKPLVSIYKKKHMVDISPTVQRLIVRYFPYQPFNVVYKKGKDIPVADALSRVTPMDPEDNIKLPIIAVNLITAHILLSAHPQDTFSRKLD